MEGAPISTEQQEVPTPNIRCFQEEDTTRPQQVMGAFEGRQWIAKVLEDVRHSDEIKRRRFELGLHEVSLRDVQARCPRATRRLRVKLETMKLPLTQPRHGEQRSAAAATYVENASVRADEPGHPSGIKPEDPAKEPPEKRRISIRGVSGRVECGDTFRARARGLKVEVASRAPSERVDSRNSILIVARLKQGNDMLLRAAEVADGSGVGRRDGAILS